MATTHNSIECCFSKYKYNLAYPRGLGNFYATCVQNMKDENENGPVMHTFSKDYSQESEKKSIATGDKVVLKNTAHTEEEASWEHDSDAPKIIELSFPEHKKIPQSMIVVVHRDQQPLPKMECENVTDIDDSYKQEAVQQDLLTDKATIDLQSPALPKIGKLKLEQLRQMCKSNGLSTIGTKEVLYNRFYLGKN